MKKLILLSLILAFVTIANPTIAQVKVNVNINVGSQPEWGPVGYDHVDYYFLPDIEAYYYVPQRQFIYMEGPRWVFAASLPTRYGYFDLYRGYKVVINEPRPYLHHDVYRTKYAKYRKCYDRQQPIHGNGHSWKHDEDGPGNGHGQGHAYGHDKHHGKD
jgi:hypothetical protein